MKQRTFPERRLIASHIRTGATYAFVFDRGKLSSRTRVNAKTDIFFGPGFLDLQCNGYAGIDFNHPGTTPADMAHAIRSMWRDGCAHVLPTLITAAPERLSGLFRKLVAATDSDPAVAMSVPGFHLEGPFISPVDGARGAHPLNHVQDVNRGLWKRLLQAAAGRIAIVTIAPEVRGAIPFIRQLRSAKILPALGHTMADKATIARACEAGAIMTTHLGNGCPQMMHRHVNPVIAQLGEDRLAASIIPDGAHLPPEVVRIYRHVKGTGRLVLVTDAMAAAGAPNGRYTIGDLTIEIGKDRIARAPGSPHLAGAAITMREAIERFIAMTGATLREAWEAASTHPWNLLRSSAFATRIPDSSVFANWNGGRLNIIATLHGRNVRWTL